MFMANLSHPARLKPCFTKILSTVRAHTSSMSTMPHAPRLVVEDASCSLGRSPCYPHNRRLELWAANPREVQYWILGLNVAPVHAVGPPCALTRSGGAASCDEHVGCRGG